MSGSLGFQPRAEHKISAEGFWRSMNIHLQKPHIINKRLWGSKVLFKDSFESSGKYICPKLEDANNINQYITALREKFQCLQSDEETFLIEIVLLELLPKSFTEPHAFQLSFINRKQVSVTFFDVTPEVANQKLTPEFTYSFRLKNESVILDLEKTSDFNSKPSVWLRDVVLPQLIKWTVEEPDNTPTKICNESLALVKHDEYYHKYNELKEKYGKEMVKIWPECTDPSKFVYEDVAIATYLLLLWKEERIHQTLTRPQTFVDLGCGNGLLVYILTKEGHTGVGKDVRKRQIWDMYSKDVILEEKTITPSDKYLFPKTDWIIGNHSDELTPWVPVISARSSYTCNFFLLPCCAYNFDGTKYQRLNSSKSQYTEYIEYIRQLCEECGFKTHIDRLKIPSTKRICLVSKGRTYCEKEHNMICDKVQNIIGVGPANEDIESPWIKDFKPREQTQKVKNCTRLDKNLISTIVEIISRHLLEDYDLAQNWSLGKIVNLSNLVQLIPEDKLRALKSECGGLQTLLRNHHHIFQVQSGKVQLRYPKTKEELNGGYQQNKNKNKRANVKQQRKPCWFYNNHPQGCPLQDNACSYVHTDKN